jgi:uncharacterized protein DUF1565
MPMAARPTRRTTRLPSASLPRRFAWTAALLVVLLDGGLALGQSGSDVTPPAAISDLKIMGPVYYVDRSNPSASDSGPGTEQAPWRTILKAVNTARAGETVLIKRGTYTESESGKLPVANSGTSGKPITFAAYPGDERLVIITGATFRIVGVSYIVVRGLKVTNVTNTTSPWGFLIRGPGTDITLSGNETYGTYSSGIGVWGVSFGTDPTDYQHLFNVLIANNLVRRACDGGYDECITVANGVNNVIVRGNEVTESGNTVNGGEGIDFKEGVFGGQIDGNYVHDLVKVGIYLDAAGVAIGPGGVENIDIVGNVVRNLSDGEGIELGTEGIGNLRNIRAFNNVIQGVARNGVTLYAHPSGSGTASGITFMNNTVYKNTRYGVRINWPSTRSSGILVRNNIGYLNGYGDWSVASDATATADHNLWGIDPLFVGAAAGNLRLSPGSPAVDAGSATGAPAVDFDGVARPQGTAFDIGAFELRP